MTNFQSSLTADERRYFAGESHGSELMLISKRLRVDLQKIIEAMNQYLSSTISARELETIVLDCSDNNSPTSGFLVSTPILHQAYTDFIEHLAMYHPDSDIRAEYKYIGDEELAKFVEEYFASIKKEVWKAFRSDLKYVKESINQYLIGSISGDSLRRLIEILDKDAPPISGFLDEEPDLQAAFETFLIDLPLYESDVSKRKDSPLLIGDEELKKSAKAFLDALNITIDKL